MVAMMSLAVKGLHNAVVRRAPPMVLALAALFVATALPGTAAAQTVYTISGSMSFGSGTVPTGSFTVNGSTITDVSVSISSGTYAGGAAAPAVTFVTGTSASGQFTLCDSPCLNYLLITPDGSGGLTLQSGPCAVASGGQCVNTGGAFRDGSGTYTFIPSVTMLVFSPSVAEDGFSNITFVARRSVASSSPLTVNITTSGTAISGTDYTGGVTSVVIGANATQGFIFIDPTADTTTEPDETVTLTVAPGSGYNVGSPASQTGTITNDEPPSLSINDVSVTEGNSGATNAVFTVSLDVPAGAGGVTFNIATANGTASALFGDYDAMANSGQTIPAGSSTYTYSVPVNGDTNVETDEVFFVNVTSVTGANVIDAQGQGTIVNDDVADTTPPVITVPSNITVQAAPGANSAVVTYTAPTANDAVDGSRPVTQTAGLGSGASFPVGVTTNTFTASDVAGNTATASFTVTVNPGAPQILGGSGNGPESGGVTANYTGTGFTGATAVHFGPNAAPSFNVISDTQLSVVTPAGTGTVDVTVTTPWGVSSTVGGTNDYEYVPAPTAPVITAPTNGGTTGATPTISGTSQAGRTLDVYIDGARVGFPTADGMGQWSYTSAALAEGSHTVRATARGPFEDSPSSSSVTFTVDGTPPAAPVITSPVSGAVTQGVNYVAGTSEPNASITVYMSVGGAGAPSGSLSTGGAGVFGRTTANGSGNWSIDNRRSVLAMPGPQGVGETSVTLTAVASDTAGNTSSASAPVTLTTDSVPPVTPTISTPTPGQTFQGGNPTFTGTAEPGSIVDVYVDSLYNGRTTANGMGGWTFTYTDTPPTAQAAPSGDGPQSGLSAGAHTVYSISRDLAGNSSTSTTVNFNIVLVSIIQTSVPNGAVAASYSQTLTASGGTAPYSYAVTAGALPAGMTLSSGGVLSGTPTAGGSFNFTVTVTDAASATASRAFSLTIGAPTVTSTSTVAAGRRGFAYSQALTGSGGTGPYSFALQSGSLPAGITLSSTGVFSGTPTVVGTFPVVVRVTDSSTGTGPYSGTVNVTLVINAAAITVTPTSLPGVMAGLPFEQTMSASGGSGAYTYAVTAGALPSGIILTSSGRLVGRSYAVGTYPFTVTATDAFGNTGSVALSIAVLARPDPSADPDVRGLDTAQAEATRRLTGVQIDNFSRRLEQLNAGGGDEPLSNGLTLNAGIADLGLQADPRTRLLGGRMFDRGTQADPDRAELDARLWSSVGTDGGASAAPAFGGPGATMGLGVGRPSTSASTGPGLNAAPAQSGGGSSPGGLRFWTGGAVTIGERDAETGQAQFNLRSSGVSLGADMAVSPTLDLGLGLGFGEEGADIGRDGSGADTTSVAAVAYGSWRPGTGVHVDAMVGYGELEFDLRRRVAIDGSLVLGDREGEALFGSLGLGFDRPVSIGRMTAYGRLEGVDARLDAYTETGSPFWALSYAARDVESLQGVLGARYVWTHDRRDSAWTPSLRLEYRHEFADGGVQNLQYADWLTGPVYQIRSSGWDRSELGLGVGLNRTGDDGWTVAAEADARVSANETSATLRLNLSRKF